MLLRFIKIGAAIVLLAAMWALGTVRNADFTAFLPSANGQRGPVRITRFYASVGVISPGQKALLCYGVENAKSVKISPLLKGVAPVSNRCLEILPRHTTHYTIMAEGYDGRVATRSVTLTVEKVEPSPDVWLHAGGLVPSSRSKLKG